VREGVGCRSVQDAEGYMVHGGGCEVQESVGCRRVQGAGWCEVQVCAGEGGCRVQEGAGCRRRGEQVIPSISNNQEPLCKPGARYLTGPRQDESSERERREVENQGAN
jgi:hypothetical protein